MRARFSTTAWLVLAITVGCGRVGFESSRAGDGDPLTESGGHTGTDAAPGENGGAAGSAGAGGSIARDGGAGGGTGNAGGTAGQSGNSGGATAGRGGGTPVTDAGPDAAPFDAGPPPPACHAGCTCEYYRGARYMLCATPALYADAVTTCAGSGMDVIRIASGTEQTWVRLRSQQASFGKFHLGATDAAKEGTWVWEDGTAFWQGLAAGAPINAEFAAWAGGEPNSFLAGENCSEVQSIQGWNDCVCDLTKPTVCKATPVSRGGCGDGVVGAGETCDDARTGQYCAANCGSYLCPSGCTCLQAGGRNVAVCTATRSFRDAAVACGRAGMRIAKLNGMNMDDDVRIQATKQGIAEYWAGAFDLDRADTWLWSDLTPLWTGAAAGVRHGFAHFGAGFPSGAASRDCLAVVADGTWQNQDCAVAKAYVCERY